MGTVTLERTSGEAAFGSADELRAVLDGLLTSVDADERIGPLLRAAHLRARFEFTDLPMNLNVASAEADEAHCVEWGFSRRAPWKAKVILRMDSGIANRWLQGEESLAIAIARGRVRSAGETKGTLFFVPIAKLLAEPYRRVIEADHPHLLLA